MSANADVPTVHSLPTPSDHAASDGILLNWVDTADRAWLVELQSERISLRSGSDVVDFSRESWSRDIYITPHDDGYIVRFETFDLGIVFSVSTEQAASFLQHIATKRADTEDRADDRAEPPVETPLLWPRVSPLAVWALISSAFVFVPVVGIIPGIVTVALLLLHRRSVRRSRAWSHSRGVCVAAGCFLVTGLVAWALGTWGLLTAREPGAITPIEFREVGAAPTPSEAKASHALGAGGSLLDRDYNWGLIAAGMVMILLSLTMHEGAHAISAWWLGDDFARRLGRVTVNPLAHIDLIGTVLLPLILFVTNAGFLFGWAKPVPVRAEVLSRPRRGHILISLAGPGANLLLAAASMTLLLIVGCTVALAAPDARVERFSDLDITAGVSASGFAFAPAFGAVCTVLKLSLFVNVFLACFNLIPIPPLDGSWVLEHLFPHTLGRLYHTVRPYGLLLFLGLWYTGVLRWLLLPAVVLLVAAVSILDLCTMF